jgi:ubiquitin C-terminal hydrolase
MPERPPLRVFPLTNAMQQDCFMNSILQVLRYIPEIHRRLYIYDGNTDQDRVLMAVEDSNYDDVMKELRRIYRRETSSVATLRQLKGFLPPRMLQGHQDSHEFLALLLNTYLSAEAAAYFTFTEKIKRAKA